MRTRPPPLSGPVPAPALRPAGHRHRNPGRPHGESRPIGFGSSFFRANDRYIFTRPVPQQRLRGH
ncbi:hypothetical protein DDQ68_05925 [Hymenobacter nivis]|uniref:Uncharacterized protein n=1 Tax=Hymenobacter nivis TaxID=1850093 RepID=A0A2Z3GJB6_9BACT|nr:hypothetical protein DDQ68_05925 [Hymenobacter nivis]